MIATEASSVTTRRHVRTAEAKKVRFDIALLFDADSVFHGVDHIAADGAGLDIVPLRPGMRLADTGGDRWSVHDPSAPDDPIADYHWNELRYSVSWKAYCFEDEHEQRTWHEHADDLTLDIVVERLVADFRDRGRIEDDVPGNPELALVIIDEYIRFPRVRAIRRPDGSESLAPSDPSGIDAIPRRNGSSPGGGKGDRHSERPETGRATSPSEVLAGATASGVVSHALGYR